MPTQICSSGTLVACAGENWIYAYTADDERILEYRIGGGAFRTSLRDLSGKILREYRLEAAANWSSFEDFIYRDSTLLASVHPTEGTRWFGPGPCPRSSPGARNAATRKGRRRRRIFAYGRPAMRLTLEYWPDEGGYVGRLREIPGVFSQGDTVNELEENIRDAYELVIEDARAEPHPAGYR